MGKKVKAMWVLLVGPLLLLIIYFVFFYSHQLVVKSGNVQRKVWVHTPMSGTSEKMPLVLVLHGYGDHPKLIEMYSGFSRKADLEKFVVAYPMGSNSAQDSSLSWNAGQCCGSALKLQIDDESFLKAVVAELINRYDVDENRVFITGFSNGAMMTYRMVSKYPEMFKAAAGVSGSIGGSNFPNNELYLIPKPDRPMPILMFHGETDIVVPYAGGDSIYSTLRGLASFTSFETAVNFWREANGCEDEKRLETIPGIEHTIFSECKNGTQIETYNITDRGHVWPGGMFELSIYGQVKGVSATDVIWDFFKQY